jgi:hypothetical protein
VARPAFRFDIDFARRLYKAESESAAPLAASALFVEVVRCDWRKGEVSPGVPDPDPLKREISSDLCESVCGVADPELGMPSFAVETPGAIAVADTVDIFGAAP